MAFVRQNLFTEDDLNYLVQRPEVSLSLESLDLGLGQPTKSAYFSVPITDSIRATLHSNLGLTVPEGVEVPMRWIYGDLPPHVDRGTTDFSTTYLVYLTESVGTLVVGEESFAIEPNTAFSFPEGITHYTTGTGSEPRLLLGPMNEFILPVGYAFAISYYPSYADAIANENIITSSGSFVLDNVDGITQWRVAEANGPDGLVTIDGVFSNGTDLQALYPGLYWFYVYPAVPCFREGTKVLASVNGGAETYVPIETLRPGDLVKTSEGIARKISVIGRGSIGKVSTTERLENRLYRCTPEQYPELTEDLYITGCHSVLVDAMTPEQRAESIQKQGRLYVTAGKYRLMACVDLRAEPWVEVEVEVEVEVTEYPIWHLSLESADEELNHGIYVNGGLLVETCFANRLKRLANFKLVK
jgi:hypothetical protein